MDNSSKINAEMQLHQQNKQGQQEEHFLVQRKTPGINNDCGFFSIMQSFMHQNYIQMGVNFLQALGFEKEANIMQNLINNNQSKKALEYYQLFAAKATYEDQDTESDVYKKFGAMKKTIMGQKSQRGEMIENNEKFYEFFGKCILQGSKAIEDIEDDNLLQQCYNKIGRQSIFCDVRKYGLGKSGYKNGFIDLSTALLLERNPEQIQEYLKCAWKEKFCEFLDMPEDLFNDPSFQIQTFLRDIQKFLRDKEITNEEQFVKQALRPDFLTLIINNEGCNMQLDYVTINQFYKKHPTIYNDRNENNPGHHYGSSSFESDRELYETYRYNDSLGVDQLRDGMSDKELQRELWGMKNNRKKLQKDGLEKVINDMNAIESFANAIPNISLANNQQYLLYEKLNKQDRQYDGSKKYFFNVEDDNIKNNSSVNKNDDWNIEEDVESRQNNNNNLLDILPISFQQNQNNMDSSLQQLLRDNDGFGEGNDMANDYGNDSGSNNLQQNSSNFQLVQQDNKLQQSQEIVQQNYLIQQQNNQKQNDKDIILLEDDEEYNEYDIQQNNQSIIPFKENNNIEFDLDKTMNKTIELWESRKQQLNNTTQTQKLSLRLKDANAQSQIIFNPQNFPNNEISSKLQQLQIQPQLQQEQYIKPEKNGGKNFMTDKFEKSEFRSLYNQDFEAFVNYLFQHSIGSSWNVIYDSVEELEVDVVLDYFGNCYNNNNSASIDGLVDYIIAERDDNNLVDFILDLVELHGENIINEIFNNLNIMFECAVPVLNEKQNNNQQQQNNYQQNQYNHLDRLNDSRNNQHLISQKA